MNLYPRTYNMAYAIAHLIEEHNKLNGKKVFNSSAERGKFIAALAHKLGAEISYGVDDPKPEAWEWAFFDRFQYKVNITDYIDAKTNKPVKAHPAILETLEEVNANQDITLPKGTSAKILSNDYGVEISYEHPILEGRTLTLECPEYPIEAFFTDCFEDVLLVDTKPTIYTDIKGKHTAKSSIVDGTQLFAQQQKLLNQRIVAKLIENSIGSQLGKGKK